MFQRFFLIQHPNPSFCFLSFTLFPFSAPHSCLTPFSPRFPFPSPPPSPSLADFLPLLSSPPFFPPTSAAPLSNEPKSPLLFLSSAQNPHLTFHYILTLTLSYGIVPVLSFSGRSPRIHKETSTVPVVRWIAGSKPGNDLHGRRAAGCQHCASETALLRRDV